MDDLEGLALPLLFPFLDKNTILIKPLAILNPQTPLSKLLSNSLCLPEFDDKKKRVTRAKLVDFIKAQKLGKQFLQQLQVPINPTPMLSKCTCIFKCHVNLVLLLQR